MLNIIYLQNFSVLPVYFCLRRSADTVSGYFIGGMQGGGAPEGWDLIIVALSVGPVAGWGHLPSIRELGVEMSGDMLVLVPKRLKMLRNVCPVYSESSCLYRRAELKTT